MNTDIENLESQKSIIKHKIFFHWKSMTKDEIQHLEKQYHYLKTKICYLKGLKERQDKIFTISKRLKNNM